MFVIGLCVLFNASNEDWATYETPYYVNLSLSSMFSQIKLKKALRETQNLRAGCSKAAQLLDVAKRPIPQG